MVRFLKPQLLARKFGDFFRKDHTFGNFETDLAKIEQNSFALTLWGMEGYLYVAPMAMGWMNHVLGTMGCKDIRTIETMSPPPGPQNGDRYRIEASWT